jgi:hypothetical protein
VADDFASGKPVPVLPHLEKLGPVAAVSHDPARDSTRRADSRCGRRGQVARLRPHVQDSAVKDGGMREKDTGQRFVQREQAELG